MPKELLDDLVNGAIVLFFAFFGGAARFVIRPPEKQTFGATVGSMVVAGFAGVLTWGALRYIGIPESLQAFGSGVGGLVGHDLLTGIIKAGERLREEPGALLKAFRRGGHHGD